MNFDRLAPHYDWMEALCGGGLLQRARTAWLEKLSGRRCILSVGEGHGRFAAACATRFPAAELTCVEASAGMLARAQARLRGSPALVRWQHADMLAWKPAGRYDAIVTCFFLDCFPAETLAVVINKLAACATPDALWLVVDFAVPPRGWARWRAQTIHTLMYLFFRVFTGLPARRLTPPDAFLRAQGFTLVDRKFFSGGLLQADCWRRSGIGRR